MNRFRVLTDVFVKTLSQLERLERDRPDLLRDARIVALSPRVWTALRERNRVVRAASDILDEGDLASIFHNARRLAIDDRSVIYLDECGVAAGDRRTVGKKLVRARWRLSARVRRAEDTRGALLASAGAAIQFDWIWNRAWPDAIRHVDHLWALFQSARPAAVIVAGVERYRDRATVKVARAFGLPTIAIPHGLVEDIDCFDYDTDAFLAWGGVSKDMLVRHFGKRPETIKILGPLHLLQPIRGTGARRDAAFRQPKRHGRRVLVITSLMAPVCYDVADPGAVFHSWREIIAFFDGRPDAELIIKPCPGGFDQVEWYADLASRARHGNIRLVSNARIEDLVDQVDVAVVLFDVTTAQFVTQALGLPTLFVRSGWRLVPDRVVAAGLPDGFESVDRPHDVRQALSRLVDEDTYRQRCLEHGERALARHMHFAASDEAAASQVIATCLAS